MSEPFDQNAASTSDLHCVLFGGNGFVGTAIAKALIARSCRVTVVSRTGEMPKHLYFQGADWAKQVQWLSGDALSPDPELLATADVVVTLIGSPPLPTMSAGARRLQAFNNGEPNAKVIRSAQAAGVSKVVLMAAEIPVFMQTKQFGYYLGKQQSIEAVKLFCDNPSAAAAILYPTGIYGTRYTKHGSAIPLSWFMKPIASLQKALPSVIAKKMPSPLVAVEQVAVVAANACIDHFSGLKEIYNDEIVTVSVG